VSGTTIRVGGEAAGRGIKSLVENLYHGSPHFFDRFRTPSRSGLYGLGQYLTNLRETAEAYAKKNALTSQMTVPRADMVDVDRPLGYLYDVNIRAPESSFIDYYSRDIASQPKGFQEIYEELKIPETMSFRDLRATGSSDREVRQAATRTRNLVRESGFHNYLTGGLEGLLHSRGISGIKLDPDHLSELESGIEKYYVVFDEDLLDIVGKPTPVYPRVTGQSEAGQPRSFGSISQLNQYLRNK
jgi:hypothetical protein